MIVSHEYKCIFVHIPRTSGTSIENTLFNKDVECNLDPNYWGKIKHFKASQVREYVGEDIWNDYFKFTVIRSPWERVLSRYGMFWVREIKPINIGSGKSLEHFLENDGPHITPWEHGTSCSDYIDEELDYICRFENREEDLMHVLNTVGHPIPDNGLVNVNPSRINPRFPRPTTFSKEANDLVEVKYRDDILRFGYTNDKYIDS